ncbi:MAG: hypothetical protein EP348_13165, partial [Alphaproteobacteria bacterium]
MAPKTPKRPRGLSDADRALWDHVARSIDPIDTNRVTEKSAKSTNMVSDAAQKPTMVVSKRGADASSRPPVVSAEEIARAMAQSPENAFSDKSLEDVRNISSRRN